MPAQATDVGNTQSLIRVGSVLCACGAILFIIDIILNATATASTGFSGLILGIFYMITGALAISAGKAILADSEQKRCLLIATLVLSILCCIDSFSLVIFSITLTLLFPAAAVELILYLAVFACSIALAVFSARNPALNPPATAVVHHYVTHAPGVAAPGYPYPSGQQPMPYPAGQQYTGAIPPKA